MRTYYFISIMFICSLFIVSTYGQTNLWVVKHSGEKETYPLSDIQRITFPDNNILITLKDSAKTGFILNDIRIVSLGVQDVTQNVTSVDVIESVILYPIPANNTLSVKFKNVPKGDIGFVIFNMQGQRVLHQNMSAGENENTLSLDIEHLRSGLYLFQLEYGTLKFTKKMIKK